MIMFYAVFVTFLLLCISEVIWRKTNIHNELMRKFIHISVGTFVAFWPFFLSWNQIRLLSVVFVVVVAVSSYLNIFKAIHAVERPTWGEILFAVTVGLLTFITHDAAIYATAVLQMSLADGLAAVIGTLYGKTNSYHVLGHHKSRMGSLAFFAVSLAILAGYVALSGAVVNTGYMVGLALVATVIENIGVRGLDNLLVPVVVAVTLTVLS
jgi:phytol kinase